MKKRDNCFRGRLALRPSCSSDLEYILTSEGHPDNAPFIRQWCARHHEAAMKDPDIGHFIVENVSDQRPVGHVILVGQKNPDFVP